MLWADGDDGFCLCLVDIWDLVEEEEGEFVVPEGDLDHVAVNGIEILRHIYGYFLGSHANLLAE